MRGCVIGQRIAQRWRFALERRGRAEGARSGEDPRPSGRSENARRGRPASTGGTRGGARARDAFAGPRAATAGRLARARRSNRAIYSATPSEAHMNRGGERATAVLELDYRYLLDTLSGGKVPASIALSAGSSAVSILPLYDSPWWHAGAAPPPPPPEERLVELG